MREIEENKGQKNATEKTETKSSSESSSSKLSTDKEKHTVIEEVSEESEHEATPK